MVIIFVVGWVKIMNALKQAVFVLCASVCLLGCAACQEKPAPLVGMTQLSDADVTFTDWFLEQTLINVITLGVNSW